MTMRDKPALASLALLLLPALLYLAGCHDSDSDPAFVTPQTPVAQDSADDGSLLSAVAALQEERLTLNNPFTASDLSYLDIGAGLNYHGAPFTTWKNDYEKRRLECEGYAGQEINGEPICLSSKDALFDCSAGQILEYGYYCGGGRPAQGFWLKEPLDGVDYCCYIHDLNVWGPSSTSRINACGAAMCLYKATQYPADAVATFPEVENARQCIYDWARRWCGGNQPQDLPAPETAIN